MGSKEGRRNIEYDLCVNDMYLSLIPARGPGNLNSGPKRWPRSHQKWVVALVPFWSQDVAIMDREGTPPEFST